MHSVRGLLVRTLIFGTATVALSVYSVMALVTNGFSGQVAFPILLAVLSVGLTADLARKLRIARARISTGNSERGKESGNAR